MKNKNRFLEVLEDNLLDYFNYKISEDDFLNLMELEREEEKCTIKKHLTIAHGVFLQIPFVSKKLKKYKNGRDFKKEDIGIENFLNELKREIDYDLWVITIKK